MRETRADTEHTGKIMREVVMKNRLEFRPHRKGIIQVVWSILHAFMRKTRHRLISGKKASNSTSSHCPSSNHKDRTALPTPKDRTVLTVCKTEELRACLFFRCSKGTISWVPFIQGVRFSESKVYVVVGVVQYVSPTSPSSVHPASLPSIKPSSTMGCSRTRFTAPICMPAVPGLF